MKQDINNLSTLHNNLWSSLYTREGLSQFMQGEGFMMSRALGQNFLINPKAMISVLEACEFPTQGTVLEIGPGIGHLTWLLLDRGLKVIAIEKDRLFAERLPRWRDRWNFDESQCTVLHQDALETDFRSLAEKYQIHHVIGNLPYNVSVPILFHLAYCGFRFDSIGVMVQKEVGERMMSGAHNKSFGRLSIVLKYLFTIKKIKTISPGAFFPPPKIDSVFLKLVPKPDTDVTFAKQFLERVAQIGFLHRRKKMRKNLHGSIVERRVLDDLMPEFETRFNLDDRAEDWPLEEWVRFATFLRDCPPAD